MSREFTKVNVDIWGDSDFRALPPAPQHLYLLLWTSPERTYCGTHDWRPPRLAPLVSGFTTDHVRQVADCLVARHFLVVDENTEEVLIRSWARFDGLMKQPRMAVSYAAAYAAVASPTLRAVLVHETQKMCKKSPELACWGDDRVVRILDHPAVSAKDLPTPKDPFGDGFAPALALGLPQTPPKVWGSVWTPPTTTDNYNKPSVVEGGVGGDDSAPKGSGRKRPSTPLPDDFEPNETNRRLAEEKHLDLTVVVAHFADHHLSKDSRFVDWQRALGTWLRRERPSHRPDHQPRRIPHAQELDRAPSGMTDEESAAWMAEQVAKRRRA